jgi:TonB family protein
MRTARFWIGLLAIATVPILAHAAVAQQQSAAPAGLPFCNANGITQPVMQTKLSLEDSYPPMSVVLGEEGNTVVNFTVKKNGTVADVVVAATSGSMRLDAASVSAMGQMLFSQPKRGGDAIDCRSHIRIVWKLAPNEADPNASRQDVLVFAAPQSWYPAQARAEHREGASVVAVVIGGDGALVDERIYKSSGSDDLDNAALAYVKTLRLKAATIDGKPLLSTAGVVIAWTLDPKEVPAPRVDGTK